MQVLGLQGPIYRGGRRSSRFAAEPSERAAARRDAVRRWQGARQAGLTAEAAAQAVGVPLSTLYRWQHQPVPRSRAPKRRRQPTWSSELIRAIERLRGDFPMWGKAK